MKSVFGGITATVWCVAIASAQTPAISRSGVNLNVQTGPGGSLQINGVQAATTASVSNAIATVGANVDVLSQTASSMTADISAGLSIISSFQVATQQCVENGQLYDSTRNQCASPRPAANQYATEARMVAAEQDIDAIENQLNQTGGSHSFCSICPAQQYVSSPCSATDGTQCSPCAAGTYSRGGYAENCIRCADSVNLCEYATCTTANNANCQRCSARVELQAAYILSGPNSCTRCPQYTYRNSNTTCAACPKDATCAAATCQANSGLTKLTGQASMSSVYPPVLNGGITLGQYLGRWNDGIYGYNPIGPHSGVSATNGDMTNPWLQVDLGQGTTILGIDRMVLYNRDGTWGCRLFAAQSGACPGVPGQTARVWNGPNEGAIMGVSDSPLTTSTSNFYPNPCTNPGDRNCRCGMITRYNRTGNGMGPYTVPCNGAVGRYAWIVLPGNNRILNFGEMEIWGRYSTTTPAYSFCTVPCTAPNCRSGMARCSGGISTAVCTPGGCDSTVNNGIAYGYNSATQQCQQCNTNTQYRNAQGTCQNCPGSCNGQPCQVTNSAITGGVTNHGPGQWRNQASGLARDTDVSTYSETATTNNPMWQLNMGSTINVASVQIWNRPGACGARLFQGNNGCNFGIVPPGSANDRAFDGPTEGATIRVSNTPCTAGQTCPGTLCGRITRPSTTGLSYLVNCTAGTSGSYVTVQLPGNGRILQLGNVIVNQVTTLPTC
mmetsp:Transcript_139772/g.197947  ORF Transcript_139772/g.197947 Transcript_139772/m.197947 type:complete len:724 (-) Transcript_139772:126-2297(-)